jgi:hypothetical protein
MALLSSAFGLAIARDTVGHNLEQGAPVFASLMALLAGNPVAATRRSTSLRAQERGQHP